MYVFFLDGWGVKKDMKLANKYFSLASQSGHVLAFYSLAQMHAKGNGVMRSCPTAVELFKNVAERGKWGEILMQVRKNFRNRFFLNTTISFRLIAITENLKITRHSSNTLYWPNSDMK